MKRIIITGVAAIMLSAAAHAQDTPVKKMNQQPPVASSPNMKNGQEPDNIMMKEGRMIVLRNGKESDMKEDAVLGNGTVVMMDGTIKTKDGKMVKLNNGESIDRNGMTTPIPAAKPPLDQTPPSPINPTPTPVVPPVKATNPVTPPNR